MGIRSKNAPFAPVGLNMTTPLDYLGRNSRLQKQCSWLAPDRPICPPAGFNTRLTPP